MQHHPDKNKKVLVAMSGGVDSSVAATLLKKQGYFVVGGYMKNFSPESWKGVMDKNCPSRQDLQDVKTVCKRLGIQFRSFNFEKEYRKKVIDYFFAEYRAGRTPNPDVMCNKEIKFGLFLEKALKLGFDYVATGHYARIQKSKIKIECRLLKGKDGNKDQSYFLYLLNQRQLSHILFPVGEYTKPEVRALAKKFGLHNWNKKDSQGICFVGHIKLREFLKQGIPERVGEIVDPSGKVIGRHRGAWYFTIGQRHGLGIGGGRPYYVIKKDVKNNKITAATGQYDRLVYQTALQAKNLHWINKKPTLPFSCKAKIRYRQKDQACTIVLKSSLRANAKQSQKDRHGLRPRDDGRIIVKFAKPQFAIAPGQAIVFYNNYRVLGGGIIEKIN